MNLVILQHPKEARHPINTGRIVKLGISNCQLWVGEDFSSHPTLSGLISQRHCALLFPGPQAVSSGEYLSQSKPDVIILIDGTWRKAKKIVYTNPQLQTLPFLSLQPQTSSTYRIRKTPGEGALSTVEAAVLLLREASGNHLAHQSLLDTFDLMIDQQIQAMGEKTWYRNYSHRLK